MTFRVSADALSFSPNHHVRRFFGKRIPLALRYIERGQYELCVEGAEDSGEQEWSSRRTRMGWGKEPEEVGRRWVEGQGDGFLFTFLIFLLAAPYTALPGSLYP